MENISKSIKNKKVMEKYFQVAITVRYGEVLKRELRSLKNTEDHYPKYLIKMDMDLEVDYEGMTKINIIDWLLK